MRQLYNSINFNECQYVFRIYAIYFFIFKKIVAIVQLS
nr:MAG TPA: hypothetical protein [Caudoviricetes sp.]